MDVGEGQATMGLAAINIQIVRTCPRQKSWMGIVAERRNPRSSHVDPCLAVQPLDGLRPSPQPSPRFAKHHLDSLAVSDEVIGNSKPAQPAAENGDVKVRCVALPSHGRGDNPQREREPCTWSPSSSPRGRTYFHSVRGDALFPFVQLVFSSSEAHASQGQSPGKDGEPSGNEGVDHLLLLPDLSAAGGTQAGIIRRAKKTEEIFRGGVWDRRKNEDTVAQQGRCRAGQSSQSCRGEGV